MAIKPGRQEVKKLYNDGAGVDVENVYLGNSLLLFSQDSVHLWYISNILLLPFTPFRLMLSLLELDVGQSRLDLQEEPPPSLSR